jgi:outer membrane receptor protein involved in Fe transport
MASSAAARDYIFDHTHYVAQTKQDDVTANIDGSPFSTWAGPVNVALSGEWRKQSFQSTSDGTPDLLADCTNLRFNCVPTGSRTLLLRNTFASTPKVSMRVWEAAIEGNVPLIKGLPLIQLLDVNAAARYTKYDTVGSFTTWKLGVNWAVSDELRFRGTMSRDIRAPTLSDLYASPLLTVDTIQDLKNAGTPLGTVLGTTQNLANPNLTAEIGRTKTAGLVYKPRFAPGLSLAIDYYDIQISNAIVSIQGAQASIQNGCNTTGAAIYCNLIQRDATGRIVSVITTPVNLAKITTYGLDGELNYQGRVLGHRFLLRGLAAYQPHIRYIQPLVPTIDQGGVAFGTAGLQASPVWRVTGILSYEVTDKLRLDVLERWRSSLKLTGDPSLAVVAADNRMKPNAQTSLNVAYTFDRRAELFLNIQNLFNTDPPQGNMPGSAGSPGHFGGFSVTDDVVGRYVTVGARLKF